MSVTSSVSKLSRERSLDLTYWFIFTPFVTGMLTRIMTLGAFALLASANTRFTFSFSLWLELPLGLLLADIAGYWSHRLRHRGFLWHFHAIHHSPTRLDALAAARMHPVDDMIDNTFVGVVLYVAGFSPQVIFAIGPILFLHIALIHANVTWDFGPLRKILVSPVHHRAHHEVHGEKNYAGMFSFLDVLFGTYAKGEGLPHGSGDSIPESLVAHLKWPFQALRRSAS